MSEKLYSTLSEFEMSGTKEVTNIMQKIRLILQFLGQYRPCDSTSIRKIVPLNDHK